MESFKSPDGWYEGRPVASGSTPQNRSLARSSPPTNRIILANPIFQAFRKQCALAAVHPLFSGIKAGKVQIIVVYKIPWGVDSDQFWGQTEVANPLNLEATNATRSPLRRTDRYPNQSWRNFRLIGTQLFNLADHVAVAWRRREDVEAQRLGWGHRCAAVALFGTQAEGVRADGAILPDHRHSRGGTGWLLDSSGAAERGNRELRCRCGLDCDVTPPAAGQDPQDRRRGFGACATGVQTRRSACLRHSQRADA